MSKKIKCAVVGCGHIGKRHAEMISKNHATELVALCDILSSDLLEIDQYEVPFPSLYNLFAPISRLMLFISVLPNGLHAQQAMDVLMEGHHVVIEKPMALKKTDCEKIISLAAKKDKHVFCVMQNRFSPPAIWIKQIINDNISG